MHPVSVRCRTALSSCCHALFLLSSLLPMLLERQNALITGSGRGIGRAIARLFAKEGAAVFLTARSEDQLAETASELAAGGGRVAFAPADLTRPEDVRRVAEEAERSLGPITILVNNAGHY